MHTELTAESRSHADSLRVVMQDQAAETIESLCTAIEAAQAEIEHLTRVVEQHNADAMKWFNESKAAIARLSELGKQGPVAWTLTEELTKRETTTKGHLWFSNPVNCMWTALYAAAGASPEPSALQAENAKLMTALAACRDAFPVPKPDATLDCYYTSAMADPLAVPDYVGACVGGAPPQAGAIKLPSDPRAAEAFRILDEFTTRNPRRDR